MKCSFCGTDYIVEKGKKGRGCPNKRNHEKQVRMRVRKLIKEKGLGEVKILIDKIPFNQAKREWAEEEYEKAKKKKMMDRDRMNGVFMICSYLPTSKEGERFDIVANNDYDYALMLQDLHLDKSTTVIDYCNPDEFCKQLIEYRDKVCPLE